MNDNYDDRAETAQDPAHDKPTHILPLIGILLLIVVGGIVYALVANNNETIVVVDQSDQVIIDENVVISDTPVFLRDIEEFSDDISLIVGSGVINQSAYVTEIISDRMFRVSETDQRGRGIIMYLDDSLDLGTSEQVIDVEVGDIIIISGVVTNDLSNQTLEADESNVVEVARAVLLVSEIEFVN
jgi:hypothetical protein